MGAWYGLGGSRFHTELGGARCREDADGRREGPQAEGGGRGRRTSSQLPGLSPDPPQLPARGRAESGLDRAGRRDRGRAEGPSDSRGRGLPVCKGVRGGRPRPRGALGGAGERSGRADPPEGRLRGACGARRRSGVRPLWRTIRRGAARKLVTNRALWHSEGPIRRIGGSRVFHDLGFLRTRRARRMRNRPRACHRTRFVTNLRKRPAPPAAAWRGGCGPGARIGVPRGEPGDAAGDAGRG